MYFCTLWARKQKSKHCFPIAANRCHLHGSRWSWTTLLYTSNLLIRDLDARCNLSSCPEVLMILNMITLSESWIGNQIVSSQYQKGRFVNHLRKRYQLENLQIQKKLKKCNSPKYFDFIYFENRTCQRILRYWKFSN